MTTLAEKGLLAYVSQGDLQWDNLTPRAQEIAQRLIDAGDLEVETKGRMKWLRLPKKK